MAGDSFEIRDLRRRLDYLETLGGVSVALHALTHIAAGSDPIGISESQVNNLVADLAAKAGTAVFTSVANGLAPASGGGTTNFLRADGTWATAGGGGGATVKQALVDIGATPVRTASVVVADAAVTAASKIVVGWGAVVATDENSPDMDDLNFAAVPGTGQFTVTIAAFRDLIRGVFRLNYVTG